MEFADFDTDQEYLGLYFKMQPSVPQAVNEKKLDSENTNSSDKAIIINVNPSDLLSDRVEFVETDLSSENDLMFSATQSPASEKTVTDKLPKKTSSGKDKSSLTIILSVSLVKQ